MGKDTKYKQMEVPVGASLEEIVQILIDYNQCGAKISVNFNGRFLYSDKVSMDSAYLEVTGKTKAEFDKMTTEYIANLEKLKADEISRQPNKIDHFKEKGREILSEKYWKEWDMIVPIRVSDIYNGLELTSALSIIKALKKGATLSMAVEKLLGDNHSGHSEMLTVEIIKKFCDRGKDFAEYFELYNERERVKIKLESLKEDTEEA